MEIIEMIKRALERIDKKYTVKQIDNEIYLIDNRFKLILEWWHDDVYFSLKYGDKKIIHGNGIVYGDDDLYGMIFQCLYLLKDY